MAPATRRVTEFTTPSDRELVATRVFDAPRELVWEACTNPDHVRHWMLGPDGWTMPVCEIDLRVGGAWHWTWRSESGEEFSMRGVYTEIVPPERLVNTESWGDEWPETLNTLILTERDGQTITQWTVLLESPEAREKAMSTGMTGGWAQSNDRLDDYLTRMS